MLCLVCGGVWRCEVCVYCVVFGLDSELCVTLGCV